MACVRKWRTRPPQAGVRGWPLLCDKFACTRNAASRVVEYDYCFFIPWTRSKMDEWARTEASRPGRPAGRLVPSFLESTYTHTRHHAPVHFMLLFAVLSQHAPFARADPYERRHLSPERSDSPAAKCLLSRSFCFLSGHLHESHLDAPRFSFSPWPCWFISKPCAAVI